MLNDVGQPCVACNRPLPWWGWCSYCFPGTPRPPDMCGPHGTQIRFEYGKVVDYLWSESVSRWRARQAAGFSRGELALPEASP